jgi:hypothetical protein
MSMRGPPNSGDGACANALPAIQDVRLRDHAGGFGDRLFADDRRLRLFSLPNFGWLLPVRIARKANPSADESGALAGGQSPMVGLGTGRSYRGLGRSIAMMIGTSLP